MMQSLCTLISKIYGSAPARRASKSKSATGSIFQKQKCWQKRGLDWRRSVHILELGGEGGDDGEGVTTGRLANLEDIF